MDGIVERIGMFGLAGLFSGFVSGLFGIGGGIVRIPLFVYLLPLFGVAHPVLMHVALGTSMALVLPSAVASTRKQSRKRFNAMALLAHSLTQRHVCSWRKRKWGRRRGVLVLTRTGHEPVEF
jgi:uncharacterized membrane protein YfcA